MIARPQTPHLVCFVLALGRKPSGGAGGRLRLGRSGVHRCPSEGWQTRTSWLSEEALQTSPKSQQQFSCLVLESFGDSSDPWNRLGCPFQPSQNQQSLSRMRGAVPQACPHCFWQTLPSRLLEAGCLSLNLTKSNTAAGDALFRAGTSSAVCC